MARVQAGEKLAVFSLEIGSDSKAIKRAVEEIKKARCDHIARSIII